jgi:hypothetical protein
MNDVAHPPPNARLVRFLQRGESFPAKPALHEDLDFDVSKNPFQDLRSLSVPVAGEYSQLEFVFSKCSHRLRAYLSELKPRTLATGIRNGHRGLVGAYVMPIQGRPVYNDADLFETICQTHGYELVGSGNLENLNSLQETDPNAQSCRQETRFPRKH